MKDEEGKKDLARIKFDTILVHFENSFPHLSPLDSLNKMKRKEKDQRPKFWWVFSVQTIVEKNDLRSIRMIGLRTYDDIAWMGVAMYKSELENLSIE